MIFLSEDLIHPAPDYYLEKDSFIVAIRGGDEITKVCWQCFEKKGVFSLQFKHSHGEKGFICYDCGSKCSNPVFQNLAKSSVEHSFLYAFLVTQTNKCKGYSKNEESRVSAPVFYFPETLEELQYHIDDVKKRFYPANFVQQNLDWMLERKNPKIRVIEHLNKKYYVFTQSQFKSSEDVAKYLDERKIIEFEYI